MNRLKVLYVDDDLDYGRTIKVALDEWGFSVELARDVDKAWASFEKKKPDLLLVDLDLQSQKNGLDFIKMVKEKNPWYPIIVFSSHCSPQTVIETTNSGVMDHIYKEVPLPLLAAKLKNAARQFYRNEEGGSSVYELSPFTFFNKANGELTISGTKIKLDGKDAAMLRLLCVHRNEWTPPTELCLALWKIQKDPERLKRYISHLRKILSADSSLSIENKYGGYYRLITPLG